MDEEGTTRQQIADHLREEPAPPGLLANEFDVTATAALDHVEHIAQSLSDTDEQVLVAPPECRDCGFSGFDDRANLPSRCPECRSEAIEEPIFSIE